MSSLKKWPRLATLPSTNFLVTVVSGLSILAVLVHLSVIIAQFAWRCAATAVGVPAPEVSLGAVYTFLGTMWGFVVIQFGAKRFSNKPGMGDEGNNPGGQS